MTPRRTRRLLLPLAACFFALALGVAAAPATAAPADPAPLLLRLSDLDPGYSLGLGPCEPSPPLADLSPHRNRNCAIRFERMWTVPGARPGPAAVVSAAAVTPNAKEAAAILARPRLVASLAFETGPEDYEVVEPAPAFGDEAVLLRGSDGSAAVVWRSGIMLAALLAGPERHSHSDVDLQAAISLAALQQARIAAPTPLRLAENDSSEVALADPGLTSPIWWLGRELPRRGKLPALRLLTSIPPGLLDHPAYDMFLRYGQPGAQAEVLLALARPSLLRRPAMRRELRRRRQDSCTQIRRFTLDDRHATIFKRSPRCPKLRIEDTPDALDDTTAVAVLPDVVVLAYSDGCVSCHGPVSRYESIAGMRRIVMALRLRPSTPPTP